MPGHSTDEEMQERVSIVANMLLNGHRRANILSFTRKEWGVNGAALDVYISRAKEEIAEVNKASIQDNKAWAIQNLKDLFRRALEAENLYVQLGALTQFSKVTGIEVAPRENTAKPLVGVDLAQVESEVSQAISVVH